ncbi:TrmJ/YjtD family RNA methyltransferase [Candidatus Woesearchaeota archaeon]|nr:TrmJ/YjtD family RNA methyltransferase [Candidatus Woesearchaeota archaeon]
MGNIVVVAQEFSNPGNCGALARVMKNFGLNKLIFLNPKCDYLSKEALDRATHAKAILKEAKVVADFGMLTKNFDYVVGTTAIIARDYNVTRLSITPEQFAEMQIKSKVALIIGREAAGMTNDELKECDLIVHIPSSIDYSTLNVSHAAAIIFYELFKHNKEAKVKAVVFAGAKDKNVLVQKIYEALDKMGFSSKEKKETQRIVWKRVVGKALLTRREAFALFGFFKKIK